MSDIIVLRTTVGNRADAERLARSCIDERLAACVTIEPPALSIYRWRGAVETGEEFPLLFKTTVELALRLRTRIVELHPYDLPVVEGWPVAADNAVLAWVRDETGK